MRLKTVLGFVVITLILFGIVPGVLAEKPTTPSLSDAVAALQANVATLQTQVATLQTQMNSVSTAITDLRGNATAQQSAIQNETDARMGGDQTLLTNVSEQQSALQVEIDARNAADANLQSQINDLEPGATVHFGNWSDISAEYQFNIVYQAETDGFVVGSACAALDHSATIVGATGVYGAPSYPDPYYYVQNWIFRVNLHSQECEAFTMPVKAGDKWVVHIDMAPYSLNDFRIRWIPLTSG